MYDCHIHSNFSLDSELTAEKACEKAMELKLDGIIFTDHYDYDYPDFDLKFNIDFENYFKYMKELKLKYKDQLKVLNGLELGIQPHVAEQSRKIVEGYDFDFVIMSVHIIDRMDPYTQKYYEGKTKYQADMRYLEEIRNTMKLFDNFDVLGHIGYIRRYSCFEDKSLNCSDYGDIIDEILSEVIKNGKGIEINTSGYRSLGTPIPDFDIVQRYRELGGEIITLGSDSHNAEHIGWGFAETLDKMKAIGFNYVAHFEGRKPVFEKI